MLALLGCVMILTGIYLLFTGGGIIPGIILIVLGACINSNG